MGSNNKKEKSYKEVELQLRSDFSKLQIIGEQTSGDSNNPIIKDINNKIVSSIHKAFSDLGNHWVESFSNFILEKKFKEAYDLFKKNKGQFVFCTNKDVINYILEMDLSILANDEKKDYLISSIALSHKLEQAAKTNKYVDILLTEYKAQLDPNQIYNLELEKANQAAREKQYNLAYTLYNDLLNKPIDTATKAWVYRDLSFLAPTPTDFMNYSIKSFEYFLQSGNKTEAITDLIGLSNYYFSKEPDKCIFYAQEALKLLEPDSALNKERIGSLYFHLSKIYFEQNNLKDAKNAIEHSINLRENLIGNSEELHATYLLALEISKRLKINDEIKEYEEKIKNVRTFIDDPAFDLKLEVVNTMLQKGPVSDELKNKVERLNDPMITFNFYCILGLKKDYSITERFMYLDKALNIISGMKSKTEEHSIIYLAIGETYIENNNIEKAIEFLNMSLDLNPYRLFALVDIINLYKKNEKWQELYDFLEKKIAFYGESPQLKYIKGISLFKLQNYDKAIQVLRTIHAEAGSDTMKLIQECVQAGGNIGKQELTIQLKDIDILELKSILNDFAQSVSRNSRMHFWKFDKAEKKYKWCISPEEVGKQLLIQFLTGRLVNLNAEILDEVKVSAGRIDLYLKLNNRSFIIELKMCGAGKSSSYAISGEDQLIHYMEGKSLYSSFLVIFDGRSRDQGKYFQEVNAINNYTIYTIVSNVSPIIKKRKRIHNSTK